MKKQTIKILRKVSREAVPAARLKEKVIPSKRRKLIERALKEAERQNQAQNSV